jgi:hypothetical protein
MSPVRVMRAHATDACERGIRRHRAVGRERETVLAEIVRAALQQRDPHGPADRRGHRREIAAVELVLEIARARRDHDATLREERRHEVGKSLARAGARLDDEVRQLTQRVLDGRRHEPLLAPRRVAATR